MVTLSSDSRPIIGRGPPLGAGFFFLTLVSVAMMILDHRGGYLDSTRLWLGAAARPIYAAVEAPPKLWHSLAQSFADRARLQAENQQLKQQLRLLRVKVLQFEALLAENRRLRGIRAASHGLGERTLIAEIIRIDVDPFRHRVRINKGADEGVFAGQPVLDAFGIVGQVVNVDKYTATLILISDGEHAIPVQINRNGIRSIAVGTGDRNKLNLPYMTVETDVKPGDLLVSSGLDGIFPAGYPVANVTRVARNPADTFAQVEARPLAQLDRDREVLLLWVGTPAKPNAQAPAHPASTPQSATTPPSAAVQTPAAVPPPAAAQATAPASGSAAAQPVPAAPSPPRPASGAST